MTNAGCCARLAQKTKARRLVSEISLANNLQSHRTTQIHVERFVSNAHRAAAQLDWCPVIVLRQLIVLKALRQPFRRRLDRMFRRRFARFNLWIESLAKHAHGTEFHPSRKLITAVLAGALELRAHGANRPPDARRASQSAWTSSSISAGSDTVRAISSRKIKLYRLRKRWIRVFTAPKPTPNVFATSSYDGEPSPALPRKTFSDSNSDIFPWAVYSSRKRAIARSSKVSAHRASSFFPAFRSSPGSSR